MTRTNTNHESPITNHVGNETRENIMTGNKETGAGLAFLFALLSFLFISQSALADNECTPVAPAGVDPSDNAGADSYTCDGAIGTYTGGVTYDSDGDLTVESTIDNNEFGGNGIMLTGSGTDSVNFVADGVEIEGRDLDGALLDISTDSGAIDILTETVDADAHSASLVTHGIRAQSVSGNISIVTTGTIAASNGVDNSIGIEAITSGNIDITTAEDEFRAITGGQYGVLAETTGDGNLTFTGSAYVDDPNGNAALDLTTDTGLLTVNITGGVDNDNIQDAAAIRLTTNGGDAVVNLADCRNCSVQVGDQGETNVNVTALDVNMNGGTTTINNNADADSGFGSFNTNLRDNGLLQASGDGSMVFNNNTGRIVGQMRLVDFNGDFTLNNHSSLDGWTTRGVSDFSQGSDTINNMAGAVMAFGSQDPSEQGDNEDYAIQTTTLRFNGGEDVFNNAGTMVIGVNRLRTIPLGKALVVEGLEIFNNSGTIVLGATVDDPVEADIATDGYIDDFFRLRDSTFVGQEGSRILLEANFNAVGQENCVRNVDLPDGGYPNSEIENGSLPANECLDLQGSTVSGRTEIVINDLIPGDRGAYNPDGNVIVDLAGSDPAGIDPGAFVLSPETVGYARDVGGVDKGLFVYTIGYDETDQAFRLYGVQSPASLQFALLGQAVNDLWRSTAASWFDRQDALRDGEPQPDLGVGIWIRGATGSAERDVQREVAAGANVLAYDNSYTQDSSSVTFGVDVEPFGIGSGRWTVGAMVGYARARVDFDAHPNTANFEGVHGGLYSNLALGNFFANLAINQTWLDMDNDVPALELTPEGAVLSTDVESLGGQLEAGWRFTFDRLDIEPLASVSMVKSTFEDIRIPADDPLRFGGNVRYEDPESLRAGLGVRLAMRNILPSVAPIDARLTTKVLNESEGKSSASIENVGPIDAPVTDTFDGTFTEVSGGLSISNTRKTVSGFVDVDAAFGDDYDSLGLSAGVRVQW